MFDNKLPKDIFKFSSMATFKQTNYNEFSEDEEMNGYSYTRPLKSRIIAIHSSAYSLIKTNDIRIVTKKFGILNAYMKDNKRVNLEYKSINILYNLLNPSIFFKANRITIIHVDAIKFFSTLKNGKLEIAINDLESSAIILSQGTAKQFRKWIKEL